MDFGLFYFDGDGSGSRSDKYRLLRDSARFADVNGFTALWTPERHFYAFGGLYPNPALTCAALAMITENVQLRAGSVVAPLHHPMRIAEDFAVIDNLSGSRVSLAFASGWTVDEFILSRHPHEERRAAMWDTLATVQQLWRGEAVELADANGKTARIETLPRPLQPELPYWITAQSEATFVKAGQMGAPVLTSLLNGTLAEVEKKIGKYREALAHAGHDPARGRVALMTHTYVGEDEAAVRDRIRGPFCEYLKSHYSLLENLAKSLGLNIRIEDFSEDDIQTLLAFGVEGFLKGRSLIGSVDSCRRAVEQFAAAGVDEVACLIDFNPSYESVMESLPYLKTLRDQCAAIRPRLARAAEGGSTY